MMTLDFHQKQEDSTNITVLDYKVEGAYRFCNGIGITGTAKSEFDQAQPVGVGQLSGYETGMNYQHRIGNVTHVHPAFGVEINEKGEKYKLSLRVSRRLTTHFNIFVTHQYELQQFATANNLRPDQLTQRNDFGVNYRWRDLSLEYSFALKAADAIIYDNGKDARENKLKIEYALNNKWQPYLELEEAGISPRDKERDMKYQLGIKYIWR